MKKVKSILIVVTVLVLAVLGKGSVAEAKTQLSVRKGIASVSELSEDEMLALSKEIKQESIGSQLGQVQGTRDASYTAYRYSQTYEFYEGDLRIAQAVMECIVWEYTDGKVHLYSRTITPSRIENYEIYRTYGRIVNTDGTLSYTIGDSVNISSFVNEWDYALEFRVTPTDYEFSYHPM